MIGEILGSYRIVGEIGKGGMGVVYRAEHTMLGSKAAVKLLLPELSSNQQIVERFFNEAKAVAMINHPGLITVFDFGYHQNGSAYIVMEFLEGESLASRLQADRPSNEFAIEFIRQVCLALEAAHDHKIVHRDLKPDNLFLCPDSALPLGFRAKILDFGIAKLSGEGNSSVKTRTGSMMGTPTYMAPEQCRGAGKVDSRADIYAMGCIAFEMLGGRPPFEAEGVGEILGKHMYEEPPALASIAPGVHPGMASVIAKSLRKDPSERQQSIAAFSDEMARSMGVLPRAVSAPLSSEQRAATAPTLQASERPVVTPATTLGGAAAANTSPPQKAGRSGLVAGAIVVLLAAGLGTALLMGGGTATSKAKASEAPEEPVQPALAAIAFDAALPQQEAADAASQQIQLSIDSDPSGADVYRALDQMRVGQTPFTHTMEPADGELVFILKRKGYQPAEVIMSASRDHSQRVQLTATAKRPPRPPRIKPPEGRALDPFAKTP